MNTTMTINNNDNGENRKRTISIFFSPNYIMDHGPHYIVDHIQNDVLYLSEMTYYFFWYNKKLLDT